MNPETFPAIPSNTCDFATSELVSILGPTASTPCAANSAWIYVCITTSYFYCC